MNKAAKSEQLRLLLKAKMFSDRKAYPAKHAIIQKLLTEKPEEFEIDSTDNFAYGLTHNPTGFKIHMPKDKTPKAFSGLAKKAYLAGYMCKAADVYGDVGLSDLKNLQDEGFEDPEEIEVETPEKVQTFKVPRNAYKEAAQTAPTPAAAPPQAPGTTPHPPPPASGILQDAQMADAADVDFKVDGQAMDRSDHSGMQERINNMNRNQQAAYKQTLGPKASRSFNWTTF